MDGVRPFASAITWSSLPLGQSPPTPGPLSVGPSPASRRIPSTFTPGPLSVGPSPASRRASPAAHAPAPPSLSSTPPTPLPRYRPPTRQTGLMVTEKNWLEIYRYEKWNTKLIPVFVEVSRRPSIIIHVNGLWSK